jgi:hypothetical protein
MDLVILGLFKDAACSSSTADDVLVKLRKTTVNISQSILSVRRDINPVLPER